MRVVLSTYDSRGGVEPLLALAVALRDAGAEATVCAPPDCADRAAEADVELVPVGGSVRELVHAASPPGPDQVPRVADGLMAAQFEVLAEVADGCDVIVTSGLAPVVAAARSVAELVGARSEFVHWCPLWLRPHAMPGRPLPEDATDDEARWKATTESYDALFRDSLNRHRASAGLTPVEHVRAVVFGDRPWLAADPFLAPSEEGDVDVVRTGAWILPDDRPLPAELEAFLDAGEPPVYVGYGSLRAPDDFARVAVEAVRAQGRRTVLARGWAGLTSEDPDDCHVVGEVNHQALFRRVAAIVHHGGAGTTTTATRSGTPQVVVPQMADQPYWAGRAAALGVGVAHDGPVPTVESLSAALSKALTEEMRGRAATVAGTIRTDGAAEAARLLVDGNR
ncbi:MAG TPA: glycosyltransferase [Frankiaceae bacterium]|nr:glycosyltransferase [Frankiaceae bacterium]